MLGLSSRQQRIDAVLFLGRSAAAKIPFQSIDARSFADFLSLPEQGFRNRRLKFETHLPVYGPQIPDRGCMK
jgi:hypothetical protein